MVAHGPFPPTLLPLTWPVSARLSKPVTLFSLAALLPSTLSKPPSPSSKTIPPSTPAAAAF
jgi:hypothetical protein